MTIRNNRKSNTSNSNSGFLYSIPENDTEDLMQRINQKIRTLNMLIERVRYIDKNLQ